MTDKKTDKPIAEITENDWMSDLDKENIKKSADMDIIPRLKISLSKSVEVIITSKPYEVKIPIEKSIDGTGKLQVIDVIHDGVKMNVICTAKSFRFQLAVLAEKLGSYEKVMNTPIRIGKSKQQVKGYGLCDVYDINIME